MPETGSFRNVLGPVYTKRQRQRCDHSAMTLVILFSLKSMEMLENGLQTHSGASSQSCHSIDTDTWCKGALNLGNVAFRAQELDW